MKLNYKFTKQSSLQQISPKIVSIFTGSKLYNGESKESFFYGRNY